MDERPAELEHAARALKDIEPPAGAQLRVRRAIDDAISRGRHRRRRVWVWVAVALVPTAALATALGLRYRASEQLPLAERDASAPSARSHAPRHDGTTHAQPSGTQPSATQPSAAQPASHAVAATPPAAARDDRVAPTSRPRAQRRRPRHSKTARAKAPSALSLEVAAYRRARALQRRDGAKALRAYRRMRRRWPHGALTHEVDLRVVETLLSLGRVKAARAAARRFVARHPHSPKVEQMRRIAAGKDRR